MTRHGFCLHYLLLPVICALGLGYLFFVAAVGRLEAASIVNGGFEVGEGIETVLPSTVGDWSGDGGSIVASENGITPFEGNQMLKFDETLFGSHGTAIGGDVWQLVDMSTLSTEIDAGLVSVWVSARFNRIVGDSQTDTQFILSARAFDGLPDAFDDDSPDIIPHLASESAMIFSDADLLTWESAMVNLSVPVGTAYLGINVSAVENIKNDSTDPEFDGHYVDNVELISTFAGDFDFDGDVDGHDFLTWQRNTSVGSLADWEANYGMVVPLVAASAAVPEPATGIMLLIGMAIMLTGGRTLVSKLNRS